MIHLMSGPEGNGEVITTYTTSDLGGDLVHKLRTTKFDMVGERPTTEDYKVCIQIRLKRAQQLHHLKTQPMFSEAS